MTQHPTQQPAQGTAPAREATQDPEQVQLDTSTSPRERGSAHALTDRQRTLLHRVLRVAYPHDRFPDGPYQRTAVAVEEAAGDGLADLGSGLDALDAAASGDFTALDEDAATHLLRDVEDAPFFRLVRSTAVVALYDDREVWALLGYEGASFDQGGYLHRGFDDLDWLPEARVTEYVGPRAEITEGTEGTEGRR